MVCRPRPYASVVCFKTIEETKVVSSHAMFASAGNPRGKARKENEKQQEK